MSRSVSYPTDSIIVCFRDVSHMEHAEDWDDFIDYIRETAMEAWPSLLREDKWLDREDRAILSSTFAYIGVSEYCGLASIWIKARSWDAYTGFCGSDAAHAVLAENWCNTITSKFDGLFGELTLLGRASNGEAFYQRM